MTQLMLRLYEDTLPAACPPVFLPHAPRALYVREGTLTAEDATGTQLLRTDQGLVIDGMTVLKNGADATSLWRWELDASSRPAMSALPSAPATASRLLLEAAVELDDRHEWLMRCDWVGFPPGGVALTHVHQGPGIRVVQRGRIEIETLGQRHAHAVGEAWFELGHAPVLAPTTEAEPTAFVRCFLLPRALKGLSSIRYVRPEDAVAPKVQQYRVYAERCIALPTA